MARSAVVALGLAAVSIWGVEASPCKASSSTVASTASQTQASSSGSASFSASETSASEFSSTTGLSSSATQDSSSTSTVLVSLTASSTATATSTEASSSSTGFSSSSQLSAASTTATTSSAIPSTPVVCTATGGQVITVTKRFLNCNVKAILSGVANIIGGGDVGVTEDGCVTLCANTPNCASVEYNGQGYCVLLSNAFDTLTLSSNPNGLQYIGADCFSCHSAPGSSSTTTTTTMSTSTLASTTSSAASTTSTQPALPVCSVLDDANTETHDERENCQVKGILENLAAVNILGGQQRVTSKDECASLCIQNPDCAAIETDGNGSCALFSNAFSALEINAYYNGLFYYGKDCIHCSGSQTSTSSMSTITTIATLTSSTSTTASTTTTATTTTTTAQAAGPTCTLNPVSVKRPAGGSDNYYCGKLGEPNVPFIPHSNLSPDDCAVYCAEDTNCNGIAVSDQECLLLQGPLNDGWYNTSPGDLYNLYKMDCFTCTGIPMSN